MDRNIRNLLHIKQRTAILGDGIPDMTDLEEGVPTLRTTSKGLQQFIRVNNVLYSSNYVRHDESEVSDDLSSAENGYVKFANGMIMQWGKENVSANTNDTVTLPIPFPNNALNAMVSMANSTDLDYSSNIGVSITTTQINIRNNSGTGYNIFWQVIGN